MVDISTTVFPLIPLRDVVVYPKMVTPLFVSRQRSIAALEQSLMRDDRLVVLVAQKDPETEDPKVDDMYQIGTLAEVMQMLKLPDGTVKVLVEGSMRVMVSEFGEVPEHFTAKVTELPETIEDDEATRTLIKITVDKFEQYVKSTKKINPESLLAVSGIGQPGSLADIIATYLGLSLAERQHALEVQDSTERLEYIGQLLSRELELADLEQQIHDRVRFNLEKTQREYYLREKLRIIQEELSSDGSELGEINEYKQKIKKAKMTGVALEKANKELGRLEKMMPQSAEAAVIRTYLDTLVSLPWSKRSKEVINLSDAEQILTDDHYGLDKVKERILEYLAVRKLAKEPTGTILCLVGPPGVGKTSLVKSIARAMNRQFARISLGGVSDESEIRGHRRTYIGAMPGRIIQAVKSAGTKNPVILLDEIEKMTRSYQGDPMAAMLEVLDPDQNDSFTDHYLDAPFSLSEVVFVATANSLDYVPKPLYDRLEVIRISGYTEEEKLSIAEQHIIPKTVKRHGLSSKELKIPAATLRRIIQEYTREAGVRGLERCIAGICRKVAAQIVRGEVETVKLQPNVVPKFLGPPRIVRENEVKGPQVGIVTGLAWTESGGETLSIEVNIMPGKGGLQLTGQLGDVMKESAAAAFSYIRSHAESLGLSKSFQDTIDIHIHIPEGATPKDGPSAGAAMCCAMISALTKKPAKGSLAMTGEITLRGRVLAIGGLKEKILGAIRAGIKTVIFPRSNEKDLQDLPAYVLDKVELIPVAHLDEIFAIVFKSQAKSAKPAAKGRGAVTNGRRSALGRVK
ncbi:MAG: endopeptidase La [Candidatus Obscuribacter sp.]|nr:endopeptidase La [Candidatus Obscuribacter sp.]MDQ5968050.1 ATP-dependent Lon protease [Cyanobacteriota bacterium erpe_2018_sw_39hr_WHONDRS-SW48-000098_B_bin.30]